jgi:hypothetical protein
MTCLVRASSLDLFLACHGYLYLPHQPTVYAKAAEAAEWGTMVHTWKETGQVVHPNKRTATSFRKRLTANKIKHSQLYGSGMHEVHVAYNWIYGYVVSFYGHGEEAERWKASFNKDWVVGTIDYLEVTETSVLVDDLKTGKWWTKRAKESAQLSFYLMCAWKLYGDNYDYYLSVTHWPRYPASSKPKRTPSKDRGVSVEALTRFEKQLQESCYASVQNNPGTVYPMDQIIDILNPGEEQCRFCPSRNKCPVAWDYSEEKAW